MPTGPVHPCRGEHSAQNVDPHQTFTGDDRVTPPPRPWPAQGVSRSLFGGDEQPPSEQERKFGEQAGSDTADPPTALCAPGQMAA